MKRLVLIVVLFLSMLPTLAQSHEYTTYGHWNRCAVSGWNIYHRTFIWGGDGTSGYWTGIHGPAHWPLTFTCHEWVLMPYL